MTRRDLPKHCTWHVDRSGKRRLRFRRGDYSVYLTATPGTPDFMWQYRSVVAGMCERTAGVGRTKGVAQLPKNRSRG
jgi:hypothetical protein